MTASSIAIGWRLSSVSGWGVYGTNLTLELMRMGRQPTLYLSPHRLEIELKQREFLEPVFRRIRPLEEMIGKGTPGGLELDGAVLHALRNDFVPSLEEQPVRGQTNFGVIFFEDTSISDDGLERARGYDRIVTGSTWNADILTNLGLTNVVNIFQGVDTKIFKPTERRNNYGDRFVIFSGGKLEYRKAQDVVVAAFKAFRQRHPEALLLFAWDNQWPQMVETIGLSPFTSGVPPIDDQRKLDAVAWLRANELPDDSFVNLGAPPNRTMPNILSRADAAVFPNRCEPGTNLVAMEAMAMGLPCVIAGNTGQLDLIAKQGESENCYPICGEGPVEPYDPYAGTDGWREPTVEETLEALEAIYADRDEAKRRGANAAEFMRQYSWENQVTKLVAEIDALHS